MRLVIVGVDGSARAAAASGWAARLTASTGAQLVVAFAWHARQAEGTHEDFADRRAAARALLEGAWCEPARVAGADPRALFLQGSPDVLLRAADDERADLVVVGNRGAGGIASLHLGSVTHHLTHHTSRPLAIVPEPTAEIRPETIVVGVDGSPGSAAAVSWCAELASVLAARVVAVRAFEPFVEHVPDDDPISWRREAERDLAGWVEPMRDRGVLVEPVIVDNTHPVAAIADTARTCSAGLIVVGTHGLGAFTRMRLGGVALELVHHIGLPVVLVPNSPHHASRAPATEAH